MKKNLVKKNSVVVFFSILLVLVSSVLVSSANNPIIDMQVSNFDPVPVVPGKTADVWVTVTNIGNEQALGLEVEFVDSFPFSLSSQRDRVVRIDSLDAQRERVIKYKVFVDASAPDGNNELLLKYSFDNGLVGYLPVDLEVLQSSSPLSVQNFVLENGFISPGGSSALDIVVKNLGSSQSLRDVHVILDLDTVYSSTGVLNDVPIVPSTGSSGSVIAYIPPGGSGTASFDLSAYPDAVSKIYKVPVAITAVGDSGANFSSDVVIGIPVNSLPEIVVTLDSTDLNTEKHKGEVTFSIVNKGISDVKLASIFLGDDDSFVLDSTSNLVYLGNIDTDDFESASFDISANADSLSLPVTLEYKDALNKGFKSDVVLSLELKAPESNGGSPVAFIVVLLIVVGVGFWWYRRRKRRREQKE